jgi:hypothetical protein
MGYEFEGTEMILIEKVFKHLCEHDLVLTAEDFSTDWCGKSRSWYAVQKHNDSDFSIPAAITCLNRVKVKTALAHLRRKRLGSVGDDDIRLLGAIKESLETYLLEHHRIAAVAEAETPKRKMLRK